MLFGRGYCWSSVVVVGSPSRRLCSCILTSMRCLLEDLVVSCIVKLLSCRVSNVADAEINVEAECGETGYFDVAQTP